MQKEEEGKNTDGFIDPYVCLTAYLQCDVYPKGLIRLYPPD